MTEKKPKIVFADATAIQALEPYVDELLECLGEAMNHPDLKCSLVSDESCMCDFLESVETGEQRPYRYPKWHKKYPGQEAMIDVVTTDTPENRKLVAQVSTKLGVPIELYDYVYEVAIRLRDK
jgi:hypothetical protein